MQDFFLMTQGILRVKFVGIWGNVLKEKFGKQGALI